MNFVDDVDLIAAGTWGKEHLFLDLPHVVYAGIGSPVNFQHIHASAPGNFHALGTDPAGIGRGSLLAAQRPRKDPCRAGLSAAPGSGKKIRMGNVARLQGIPECGSDKLLPRQFIKGLWSPPRGGYFIRHFSSIAFFGINLKASARVITAQRPSACRCFLPNLAELGGGRSHDS